MEVQLLVRSSSGKTPQDYVFPLKERVVLGRSPESPVPLEGPAISREHLVLELVGDAVYATDLSNNGTWINGNRLRREERIQLASGDSMELPDYQISFQIRRPAEGPAAAQKQTRSVSVVIPSDSPPPPPKAVRREMTEMPKEKTRSFTLLDVWILLLAVLALGLIAYYAFLVP
ncbi:MAG: FHA domain-containing protein [Acidobacteria bacterium]|nr:FHA domain-containing protein [Acidobacteriota bacterium]